MIPAGLAAAYDAMAARYAGSIPARYRENPLHHAMTTVFAGLVRDAGPVADVGCGPGHVTAHLRALGVDAYGVDLSPRMVALAREGHPGLRFDIGTMEALDASNGSLAGVVANQSIIHTPPEPLAGALAEFRRVLAPGGHLLLGFPSYDGDGPAEAYDHQTYPAYRHSAARVAGLLAGMGLREVARMAVAPGEDPKRGFEQVYLLTRRG
ncbi:class I SAM-dependent methyltransferase [Nonomuraea sp. NPDC004297]